MRSDVTLMREQLERLKSKQTRLRIEARGLAQSISPLINPLLKGIEDMDVAGADSKMDELKLRQAELLGIRQEIWDLEEALG